MPREVHEPNEQKWPILDMIEGLNRTGWHFSMNFKGSMEHYCIDIKEKDEVDQCCS